MSATVFRFNRLKHHLLSMKAFVESARDLPVETIARELLVLGASQMDVYSGVLDTDLIYGEVQRQLDALGRFERLEYLAYLEPEGFQSLFLSDGSEWVLRAGETETEYIHLHPARYSNHSFRVKANTLKTALLCTCKAIDPEQDFEQVNRLRQEFLGLSPLSSFEKTGQVRKIIALFEKRDNR